MFKAIQATQHLVVAILIVSHAAGAAFAADPQPNLPPTSSIPPLKSENRLRQDPAYPIPYVLPTKATITEVLQRVLAFAEQAMPARVINRTTGSEITDFSASVPNAISDHGENSAFNPIDYTMGVTHAGMLLAAETTGDARYAAFTARHMQFIHDRLPYFQAQAEEFGMGQNSFRAILDTDSLDASGSMCAALIKARLANVGPDLRPVIDHWIDYVHTKQFRLADGTLARHRPQPESIWADDLYMSVPALAQMGKLTGDRQYYDDAVKQVLQFAHHLFNREKGIYMHGRNLNQPANPEFYWGRANGWAMMATVELLDVLPEDYPSRGDLLNLLRAHVEGVAPLQSGSGLWHQMLDKTDSYLETSASAMFVFSLARAVNRGWIAPVSYGSTAQAGWNGVATQVNARGQVEGTCVGTTFASDNVYYYHRPASVYASHGYGPVLLAGAEMIRLLQNPAIDIQSKNNTYHYVPKAK
jgi:rhamnogalacturonyl hydrolase YesR